MKNLLLCGAFFVASLLFSTGASAQFDDATHWVPDGANMIVLVRSADIFDSDIAVKEKWKKESQKAFRAGVSMIPPTLDQFMIASSMDLVFMEPIWQVSVFEDRDEIDLVEISKEMGGNIDRLDGNESLVLPGDAYLVKVGKRTLAAMSPANRQMAFRWIRRQKNASPDLSDYLTSAVKYADSSAHIIAAIDFEHVVCPTDLQDDLKETGILPDEKLEKVSQLLCSLQGITLGVTMTDKIVGALKIDFDTNCEILKGHGKELVVNALKSNGLFIDGIEDWNATVSEKQLMLRGTLSASALRQISTLIEQPLHSDFGYASEGQPSDTKTRSLQYFKALESMLEDLRGREYKSLVSYAKFFDKYALRVDHMSVLNVDPALVEYGKDVADGFRQISGILFEGEYGRLSARGSQNRTGDYYRGYRGRYNYYNNRGFDRRVEAQAKMRGGNRAMEVIRELDSVTADVRKRMTQKYEIDF